MYHIWHTRKKFNTADIEKHMKLYARPKFSSVAYPEKKVLGFDRPRK